MVLLSDWPSAIYIASIWKPIPEFFEIVPEGPAGSDEFSLVLKTPFELESDSGCIRTDVIFNDNLTVTDSGEPPLSNTVPIQIFVTDINNHRPLIKLRQGFQLSIVSDRLSDPWISLVYSAIWFETPCKQYDISFARRIVQGNDHFEYWIFWSWSMQSK